MFLHVVQCTLSDSFLENKVFQLMTIAVILDSSCDFAEAIQKHFVLRAVLLIIPRRNITEITFTNVTQTSVVHFCVL